MKEDLESGLKREVGVLDVATNVLSISIGSGIFLLPAIIFVILGNASILAYVFCGLLFLLLILCFAEVSSRVPETGGLYVYIEKAFGPLAGFVSNNLYWFGVGVLVCAALLNATADILSVSFPLFSTTYFRIVFFGIVTLFITYLNVKGIKEGMNLVKFLTVLKVIPLILLIGAGLYMMDINNLEWKGFPEMDSLGSASLILIFAFVGGESALTVGGEMKNPKRTAPLGLLIGIIGVVIGFSVLQISIQGVMGSDLVNHQEAPLAEMAKKLAGNPGFIALLIVSVIAVFGTYNSVFLLFSRLPYAGAKKGLLPTYLKSVHKEYQTPHLSIISFGILSFLVSASGGFQQLAVLIIAGCLVLYVAVILAFFKLRFQDKGDQSEVFKIPAGYLIASITLAALVWVFFQLKVIEIQATSIFIIVLCSIYYLNKALKKNYSVIP